MGLDPAISYQIEEEFDAALEADDQGDSATAERIALDVVRKCPNHIDALHHVSLWLDERVDDLAAYVFCQAAVAIGLHAISANFDLGRCHIPWSYLRNRPFLRAYHALARHRIEQQSWDDAILILGRLLAVNPNDDQGVRYEIPDCWFATGNIDAVVEHCRGQDGDASPFISYSNALALTLAKRVPEAIEALAGAIRASPLVADKLLADRHPEPDNDFPGSHVLGGPSEAWLYCNHYGEYWQHSDAAMKLLRQLVKSQS